MSDIIAAALVLLSAAARTAARRTVAQRQLLHRGIPFPEGWVPAPDQFINSVGQHWTSDLSVAEAFSDPVTYGESFGSPDDNEYYRGTGAVVSAWHDPATAEPITDKEILHKLHGGDYPEDKEVTFSSGAPLEVHSIKYLPVGGQEWKEISGVQGNRITAHRTAARADDSLPPPKKKRNMTVGPRKPVNPESVDRIEAEFNDWWDTNDLELPPDSWDGARGPIGHWGTVEKFLRDKYPAAYQGFSMGLEEAADTLDRPEHHRNAYPTGPEAIAQYGYDPAEIAASLVLLHSQTHPFRRDEVDQRRLTDIFDKRMRMQRDYEKRTSAADLLVLAAKTQNGILADETIDRVRSEFRDWYEKKNPAYSPESASQHWTNIENFFADHYPATHRGLTYGYENARPLLKQKNDAYWGDIPDADPYETGPEAVETHGYDPAEIAAAGLYLHNEGRWNRREFQNSDRNLLMKVIRERHKMEQARNSRPRQLMLPLDLP